MAAGIGAAAAGDAGLGAAKAPVMRWNRLGERLSAAAGRAVMGRAIGSVARTAGRAAGRLTRQSVSSTNGLCGTGAGAGVGAGAAAAGAIAGAGIGAGAGTGAGGATGCGATASIGGGAIGAGAGAGASIT